MVKSASAKSVSPGEEFSYTITYQNTGTKVSDALRIEDPLPDYVTFVSATQGGAPDTQQSGTIVWNNLPALAPGTSDSVQVVVKVDDVVPNGTRTAPIRQRSLNPLTRRCPSPPSSRASPRWFPADQC